MIENLDVDWRTACKTNWIIPVSFQLSVIVFHLNFCQNYLKRFSPQKIFLKKLIIKTSPHPLKQRKSAKHDEIFLLMFPQILPCNLTLFSNHHPTQPITICNDYLPSAYIRYFTKYFKKIFSSNKSIGADKGENRTMDREIC